MAPALSRMLREGTAKSHRLAEGSAFVQNFLTGGLTVDAYARFLVQLFHVYQALEAAQDHHRTHPVLSHVLSQELYRKAALERDLEFFYPDEDWRQATILPATTAYVKRLIRLAHDWPEGLVAHHYTRYMGDLSGGQILKKAAAKMVGPGDGRGLEFYEFPAIPEPGKFKKAYRERLDALPLDDVMAARIVEEANNAFRLNGDIFNSLS